MAMLPSKRLLLLAFLLLSLISTTARARILREKEMKEGPAEKSAEKGNGNVFKPNQGVEQDIHDDLATMDYTPAGKNPPIHN